MSQCPPSAASSRSPTSPLLSTTEWLFSLLLTALLSAVSGFFSRVRVEERTHPARPAALELCDLCPPFFSLLQSPSTLKTKTGQRQEDWEMRKKDSREGWEWGRVDDINRHKRKMEVKNANSGQETRARIKVKNNVREKTKKLNWQGGKYEMIKVLFSYNSSIRQSLNFSSSVLQTSTLRCCFSSILRWFYNLLVSIADDSKQKYSNISDCVKWQF